MAKRRAKRKAHVAETILERTRGEMDAYRKIYRENLLEECDGDGGRDMDRVHRYIGALDAIRQLRFGMETWEKIERKSRAVGGARPAKDRANGKTRKLPHD